MKHCINVKHSDVVELSKELGLHEAIVASKIALWQERNNNFDRFPTKEELSISGPDIKLFAVDKNAKFSE